MPPTEAGEAGANEPVGVCIQLALPMSGVSAKVGLVGEGLCKGASSPGQVENRGQPGLKSGCSILPEPEHRWKNPGTFFLFSLPGLACQAGAWVSHLEDGLYKPGCSGSRGWGEGA